MIEGVGRAATALVKLAGMLSPAAGKAGSGVGPIQSTQPLAQKPDKVVRLADQQAPTTVAPASPPLPSLKDLVHGHNGPSS